MKSEFAGKSAHELAQAIFEEQGYIVMRTGIRRDIGSVVTLYGNGDSDDSDTNFGSVVVSGVSTFAEWIAQCRKTGTDGWPDNKLESYYYKVVAE